MWFSREKRTGENAAGAALRVPQSLAEVYLGAVNANHNPELARARDMQRQLLPSIAPQLPGFQIACAWQPSQAVSADYFDVFPLGDDRMALCIADVSGKGIAAALLMGKLQSAVRSRAPLSTGPAELCADLNRMLCESTAQGQFATLFYGSLDPQARQLRYENAGHCLPLLVHGDGSILMPVTYSGVLGLFSHWTYQQNDLALQSGDCLVMMTGGILEAANRNQEEYGYQRLIDTVKRSKSANIHEVRMAIVEDVSKFCQGRFDEDASLIVVTVD